MVLTETAMPGILAEVSFVSSPTDEQKLRSDGYREEIAEALYKGIAQYAANSAGREGGERREVVPVPHTSTQKNRDGSRVPRHYGKTHGGHKVLPPGLKPVLILSLLRAEPSSTDSLIL